METKKSNVRPLSDEERARKWKIIQGLAAQVLEDTHGKDVEIVCQTK